MFNYHYDSFGFEDRPIKLRAGKYQLIAEVLSFGEHGPINEIHKRGGLLIQGGIFDDQDKALINLGTQESKPNTEDGPSMGSLRDIETENNFRGWKVLEDTSFGAQLGGGVTADTDEPCRYYWALGYTEAVDLNKMADDPFALPLTDQRWQDVAPIGKVVRMTDPPNDFHTPWILVPSVVPQPELSVQTFHHVVRCSDNTSKADWEGLLF